MKKWTTDDRKQWIKKHSRKNTKLSPDYNHADLKQLLICPCSQQKVQKSSKKFCIVTNPKTKFSSEHSRQTVGKQSPLTQVMNIEIKTEKQKLTNVGRIALEQHAGGKTFDHAGIRTTDIPISNQKHCPLGYQPFLVALLQSILY